MSERPSAGVDTARTGPDAPNAESCSDPSVGETDLTRHDFDLLVVLSRLGPLSGSEVADALADRNGEGVYSTQLYPNLNDLAADGLLSKSERDGRTNEYELTSEGRHLLVSRANWFEHAKDAVLATDGGTRIDADDIHTPPAARDDEAMRRARSSADALIKLSIDAGVNPVTVLREQLQAHDDVTLGDVAADG